MKKTLLFLLSFYTLFAHAQNTGDYRTIISNGVTIRWGDVSSWETFDGSNWVSASITPDASSGKISVRDTITVNRAITIDEVIVENAAYIRSDAIITLNSGLGDEITFNAQTDLLFFHALEGTDTSSNIKVNSGGSITMLAGNFDSLVTTHIELGGTLVIDGNRTFQHHGIINNYGTIDWKNQSGISTIGGSIGKINNYHLFKINSFNFSGNPYENHRISQQFISNYGTVNISGGSAYISFAELRANPNALSRFNNYGEINLIQGKINFTQETYLKGTINISPGTYFKVSAYKYQTVFANHVFDSLTIQGEGSSDYDGSVRITQNNAWLKEDHSVLGFDTLRGPGTLFCKSNNLEYELNYLFSGTIVNQLGGNLYIKNQNTRTLDGTLENNGNMYLYNGGINHGTGDFVNKGKLICQNMMNNFFIQGAKFTNYDSLIFNDPTYFLEISTEFEQKASGVLQVLQGELKIQSINNQIDGRCYIANNARLAAPTSGMNMKGDTFICDGIVRFGLISFNGNRKQVLKGSGEIRNVKVDNANHLELGSDFSILLELNLVRGKCILNEYNLHLKNPSFLTANKFNYVVTNGKGRLKAPVNNANTIFYIGTANNVFPVTMSNIGTADNFSVRVMPNLFSKIDTVNGIGTESQVTEKGIAATWFISEEFQGGSNVTLQLHYLANAILPNYDSTESRVLHFTNDKWSENPGVGSVYRGDGFRSVSRFGLTHFSPFAIWSGAFGALPVELIDFNATLNAGVVELTWQTATETNNQKFEIYRSTNGEAGFLKIGELQGAGNSNQLLNYRFIDNEGPQQFVFYKLKQIDFNGEYVYSQIQMVNLKENNHLISANLSPNPAKNQVNVQWENHLKIHQVRLLDKMGKVLLIKPIYPLESETTLILDSYESGYYYIEVLGENYSKTFKLMKK